MAVVVGRSAPATAAGGADAQHVARLHIEGLLAGQVDLLVAALEQDVLAMLAVVSAVVARRGIAPSLGQHGDTGGAEELDIADQAITSLVQAVAAGATAQ